jgi:hypothetical protein
MSSDIVTLQMKLMQARNNDRSHGGVGNNSNQPISFYRMHTAAVERANYLLESKLFSFCRSDTL